MVLTKNLYRVFQNSHTRRDWFFSGKSPYMGKIPCMWAIYWGSFLWEKNVFFEESLYWKISLCVLSSLWCVESLKIFKDPCVCELCTVKFDKKSLRFWKIVNLSNTVGKSTPHNNIEPTCKGTFETDIPQTGEICGNYAKLSNSGPTQRISLEKAFFSKFTIIFTDALKSETLLCVGIVLWYVETFKMF